MRKEDDREAGVTPGQEDDDEQVEHKKRRTRPSRTKCAKGSRAITANSGEKNHSQTLKAEAIVSTQPASIIGRGGAFSGLRAQAMPKAKESRWPRAL